MRIGQTTESLQADQVARTGNRGTTGSGALRDAQALGATDKVELSSASRKLTSPDAPMNTAQIDSLRKAIAAGTFRPDPAVVADKMIGEAAELFERMISGQR